MVSCKLKKIFRGAAVLGCVLASLGMAQALYATGASDKGAAGKKGTAANGKVIIYTCTEDFRTAHMQKLFDEKFPGVVTVQVLSTGNLAAKLKAEGSSTEADIILNLETGYMKSVQDTMADLSSFDSSAFLPELVPANHKYLPWDKSSGVIAIDTNKLKSLKIPVPQSFDDLLKPAYKGLISMPSPKTSATGFMYLIELVNLKGEDGAFAYFDKFAQNVLQFTTSGSGPVNALLQGEAAIGLGMTITAVDAIDNRNAKFEMCFFKEGAPYNTSSMGIIKGRESKPIVRDVFNYIIKKVVVDDNQLYCPEAIFKNQTNNVKDYPKNIHYADMKGETDLAFKQQLLDKWKY
jgi:iron(III) transport system substrate-binding protein